MTEDFQLIHLPHPMVMHKVELMNEPIEAIEARADALLEAQENLMRDLVTMRGTRDLKQHELATRMGISQSAVSQFERYDSNPKLSTLRRYALAIGARLRFEVLDDYVPAGYTPAAEGWLETVSAVSAAPISRPARAKTPTTAWGSSSWQRVVAHA